DVVASRPEIAQPGPGAWGSIDAGVDVVAETIRRSCNSLVAVISTQPAFNDRPDLVLVFAASTLCAFGEMGGSSGLTSLSQRSAGELNLRLGATAIGFAETVKHPMWTLAEPKRVSGVEAPPPHQPNPSGVQSNPRSRRGVIGVLVAAAAVIVAVVL